VDRPWNSPVQYAYEYYAKYPALGLVYWPLLFHMVEGLSFLVFGISVLASRLTILAYALVGVFFWYKIAEREGPQSRALASAFIFPLLPYMLRNSVLSPSLSAARNLCCNAATIVLPFSPPLRFGGPGHKHARGGIQ